MAQGKQPGPLLFVFVTVNVFCVLAVKALHNRLRSVRQNVLVVSCRMWKNSLGRGFYGFVRIGMCYIGNSFYSN